MLRHKLPEDLCGCGASLNNYARRVRSSEGSEDGHKVFVLANSGYRKIIFEASMSK